MLFNYKATNASGEPISGVVESDSEREAYAILEENGFEVVSLKERSSSVLQIQLFARIPNKDVVIMARQLSVMVSANVPIVESIRILIRQTINPQLRTIISEIADEVEGGSKLSLALSRHPKVFSNFFIALVRSGETSGKLAEVLNYLADQLEKDHDLNSKIRGAMIYPAFILTGLIVVGIVMMIFVVPQITSLLTETGAELPITTRALIGLSNFFVNWWWALLLAIGGAIGGILYALRTESGKEFFDYWVLKLPIFGPLLQRIYIVRFTRSLQTLIIGKVPLAQGLRVVADVVGNTFYQRIIEQTIAEVEDGSPIASVFERTDEIPVMVSQMLSIGEQSGKLDLVLEKITSFYAREIDNTVANLVTLIEPIVMVVMGIAVGGMVAAIVLPMYNLAGSF